MKIPPASFVRLEAKTAFSCFFMKADQSSE